MYADVPSKCSTSPTLHFVGCRVCDNIVCSCGKIGQQLNSNMTLVQATIAINISFDNAWLSKEFITKVCHQQWTSKKGVLLQYQQRDTDSKTFTMFRRGRKQWSSPPYQLHSITVFSWLILIKIIIMQIQQLGLGSYQQNPKDTDVALLPMHFMFLLRLIPEIKNSKAS